MIGAVLLSIIIIMSMVTYIYRDEFFKSTVNIEYPDGCVETYINKELVSNKCVYGREIVNRSEPLIDYEAIEWPATKNMIIVPSNS